MAVKEVFYRRELDCLRFFAFFIVFIFHFFPQHPEAYQRLGNHAANILSSLTLAGGLGVDLFFCLSSFLITTLLLREQATTGTVNVKAFWTRRMLRIWPLYYFFIAFTVFVVPYMLPEDDLKGWGLVGFLFFSGNWVCAFSGFPSTVACPLWSVSIEEQFYLLWPLVILLVGIRRLPHVAVLSLVVANVARIVATVYMDPQHPAIWCNTFTRLDPIAMGALLAVFCIRKQFSLSNRVRVIVATLSLIPIPASFLFLGNLPSAALQAFGFIRWHPSVAWLCL